MSHRRPRIPMLLLSLAIPAAAAAVVAAPSGADGWKWTPELVADITRLHDVQISPDGRRIVYAATRPRPAGAPFGGAWANLWVVGADGDAARRLTSADAEDKSPAWSSDSRTIAFLSSRGGDKAEKAKTRLYLMSLDGGEAWPLTGEKVDVESFAWSRDGRRIAYLAVDAKSDERERAEKAGKDWKVVDHDDRPRRLWVVDVPPPGASAASPAPRPVAALGERSAWQFAWAPDGRALVATVTDTPRTDDSYMKKRIEILPLAGDGRGREVAGVVGKVDQVLWSRDGRTIVWRGGVDRSDPTPGSIFARGVDEPAGAKPVNLTAGREETVRDLLWADGRAVVAVAVQGTRTSIVAHDLGDRSARRTLLEGGRLAFEDGSASDDGTRFAFGGSTPDGPEEVYAATTAIEPKARGGPAKPAAGPGGALESRRLTDLNPQLEGLPRGRQEVIRWKASDGLEIEGILIAPPGDRQRSSYPLVVIAHGGPEYEYHDGWVTRASEPAQALAERGSYVFLPNYRGSAGRGVAFAKGDHDDLGGREFQDVLDGIDWLVANRRIDRARVGMTGGSYGGYFTSLAVTRYSDRFAAGVALYGISNWMSFLGQSDIPMENSEVHWNLWCYEHEARCADASAVHHVDRARTPTLIFQGEEDKRVPKPQSDELYAALKWKGVPAEYVVFPREKHGFVEREHQIEAMRRTLDWFDKYLKP